MKNLRGEQHDKRRDPSLQALSLVEFGRLGQAPDKRECNTKFVLPKQFTVIILKTFFSILDNVVVGEEAIFRLYKSECILANLPLR